MDFNRMLVSIGGDESGTLDNLESFADETTEYLDGANTELEMYDLIRCRADRYKVKGILISRLHEGIGMLNTRITAVDETLDLVKYPAEMQKGLQMKNELGTVKRKARSHIGFS
jgi:hypothetical protein